MLLSLKQGHRFVRELTLPLEDCLKARLRITLRFLNPFMERSFRKSIILVLLLILMTCLAGKFYADSKMARAVVASKPRATEVRVPKPTDKKCNVFLLNSIPDNYYEAKIKYSKGSAVCYVYGRNDLISNHIITHGNWERGYVDWMERQLTADPALGLIDIGCNLGGFTIVAAMLKRKVVAVDANIQNIRRLRKSLLKNNVQNQVQLLYNGIADRRHEFSLSSPERGNIGHSLLTAAKANDSNRVKSILMDDLLEVIDFKSAFMKIDIEGHEFQAFHKADELFRKVNIKYVVMEWHWLGTNPDKNVPKFLVSFFQRFNYLAYPPNVNGPPLKMTDYTKWPWDIVWKKQTV